MLSTKYLLDVLPSHERSIGSIEVIRYSKLLITTMWFQPYVGAGAAFFPFIPYHLPLLSFELRSVYSTWLGPLDFGWGHKPASFTYPLPATL